MHELTYSDYDVSDIVAAYEKNGLLSAQEAELVRIMERNKADRTLTMEAIGARFGVSQSTISKRWDAIRLKILDTMRKRPRESRPCLSYYEEPPSEAKRGRPRMYFKPEDYIASLREKMNDEDFGALVSDPRFKRRMETRAAMYWSQWGDLLEYAGDTFYRERPAEYETKAATKSGTINAGNTPAYRVDSILDSMLYYVKTIPRNDPKTGRPYCFAYYEGACDRFILKIVKIILYMKKEEEAEASARINAEYLRRDGMPSEQPATETMNDNLFYASYSDIGWE